MRLAVLVVLVACGETHEAAKPSVRASAEPSVAPAVVADARPIARALPAQGPAGPRIAWSLDAKVGEPRDLFVAWAANGSLVVKDDDGVRVVRGGKVAWTSPVEATRSMVVGNVYVAEREPENQLVTLDLGSRRPHDPDPRRPHGARGDDRQGALADHGGRGLPARAGDVREASVPRADRDARGPPITEDLAGWRGAVVAWDNDRVVVADRRGTKLAIEISADNTTVAGDEALVVDDTGVAILALPGCLAHGTRIAIHSTADLIHGYIIAHQPEEADQRPRAGAAPRWRGRVQPARRRRGYPYADVRTWRHLVGHDRWRR